jgi:acetyl-CoA carboxylase carboxyl transferase subunit beta
LNSVSNSDDPHYDPYIYDTKYSWKNHINSCIDSFFRSQICIDSYVLSGINNYSDSYIYSYIFYESRNSSENQSSSIKLSPDGSDIPITETESSNDLDVTPKYRHL